MPTMRSVCAISRRSLFLAALPAVLVMPRLAAAQAGSRASAFVKAAADELVAVVNGPGSVADKRRLLRRIVDAHVDVEEIGRFSLGRFWRAATPEQQKQYLELFHSVMLNNVTGRLGEYQGVRVTITRSLTREDTEVVSSTVERPNNPPAIVDWVVGNLTTQPKIIDVVAEGTSMRLTQRSDYAAYLARNNSNVQALIDAMRQQLTRLG